MGNFLKSLQTQSRPNSDFLSFFHHTSLTKLKQYHTMFKQLSQTDCIDHQQFAKLLQHADINPNELFELLDTDHNLLIDGLEFFSALGLLSNSINFNDKIKFLFSLFDFNGLRSLSRTDLQFLILSACSAISKIFLLFYEQTFVQDFVKEQFTKDQRINISQIIKWAHQQKTVQNYFALIGHPREQRQKSILNSKLFLDIRPVKKTPNSILSSFNREQEQFIEKAYRMLKDPVQDQILQPLPQSFELDPKPNWVFGIRYHDVKMFLEYADNELIYYAGKIIILYDVLSHRQRFYQGHRNQIISLASSGVLCASGQFAPHPQIKIWNRKSLQTVNTLRGHRRGVHLLMFMNNLLVSCGSHEQSPVLIHSIQTGQVLYNTYCASPAVDLACLINFTSKHVEQFIICHLQGVDHFVISRRNGCVQIQASKLRQLEANSSNRLSCACFYTLNTNYPRLGDYDDCITKYILVGYQHGQVELWNFSGQKEFVFSQQQNQIIKILPTEKYLFIISNSSFIKIYDIVVGQPNLITTVDFTQIDHQLLSYDIYDISYTSGGQLLIVTQKGEIVFLKEFKGSSNPSLTYLSHQQYHIRKVEDVVCLERGVTCQKMVSKGKQDQALYLSQGNCIRGIDMASHRFMFYWNLGQPVLTFDALTTRNGSILIIAATKIDQEQSQLCSFSDLTEHNAHEVVQGAVLSILLVVEDNPFHVVVLVSTHSTIYRYNYAKNSFVKASYLSLTSSANRLTPLEQYRMLLNSRENVLQTVSVGRQTQQMHLQVLEDKMVESQLPIKVHFYLGSIGESQQVLTGIVGRKVKGLVASRWDGSIDIWGGFEQLISRNGITLHGHTATVGDLTLSPDQRYLISGGTKDKMLIQWKLDLLKQQKSAVLPKQLTQQFYQKPLDMLSLRKIQYCMFSNDLLSELYDQHLVLTGLKYQSIKRLFRATLADWKNMHRGVQSSLQLKLDFVFGIQTFHKNNTVLVINEPKRILYFVGKLVVIYNPALNSQTFYRGHKYRVTSLVLFDSTQAVSGQSSYQPLLHVWHVFTLQTLRVIHTQHVWGILELAVEKNVLLSYGFREKRVDQEEGDKPLYSYQLHDLENGHSIAYGKEKYFIHTLCIDPGNVLRFVSCAEGRVTFWSVIANTIVRRNICQIPDTPTACLFFGGRGEPDLLVGTKSGAIGMVVRERYWHVFQRGEKGGKQINCLLVVPSEQETWIVTTSQDNLLRIWTNTFEQRLRVSMIKQEQNQEARRMRQNNRSLQSLCILDSKELTFLGATRCGEIVELKVGKEGMKRQVQQRSIKRFSGGDGVQGRSKVLFAHHPRFDVAASLGQDQVVIFWDCDRRKLLHMNQLGLDKQKTKPTVLKFSSNGQYLIIGFSDGLLMFLDSKISKAMQGKGDQKYSQPSMKPVVNQKGEEGWSIVGIEISDGGQFMAVSYHKLNSHRSVAQVKIFASRINAHKLHRQTKLQDSKVYQLHSTVDNPHLDHVYTTASGLACGFAVSAMTFAEYEGSHYLLMFFQLLDQNRNKVWTSQGDQDLKYKIRHVNNKTDSANTSSLNQLIRWKKPHFFGALSANYIIYQQSSTHHQPQNNHLRLPQFTVADVLEGHLVLGSENGDVHLIGASMVQNGGIGSTISAHSCKINQIEHNCDRSVLYTTGYNDNSILKWVVQPNLAPPAQPSLDNRCDLLAQIPQKDYLHQRLQTYRQNFSRPRHPIYKLTHNIQLHDILGRKAYGLRNNLKGDKQGRLVYHSGQAVVIADTEGGKQFLHVRDKMVQEVSNLQISKNGQLLVVAYAGVKSALMVWSVSSKLLLSQLYLEQITRIIYLSISDNNDRLLVYGLRGKQAEGCILMVDLIHLSVIATTTYLHKENWQVKAISFAPHSYDRFVTCGVEPLKLWHCFGGQLLYTAHATPDPTRIHTCLVFARQHLVSGTDDGQLVLWKEEPVCYLGHQEMVTCLASISQDEDRIRIASGSEANLEGQLYQIIIWSVINGQLKQQQQVSTKKQLLNTSNMLGGRVNSRYQSQLEIQSLHFNKNKLIIGLLKGDIYSYTCKWKEEPSNKIQTNQAEMLMAYEDGESAKALFFTQGSDRLVDISQQGLLRIWKFPRLELLWSRHFESEVVDMVYSSVNQLVLVGFRGQLKCLVWSQVHQCLEQQEHQTLKFNFLTHLLLNPSQKLVALGIQNPTTQSNTIQLYELTPKDFKMKVKMNFQSSIQYIDFNRNSGQKHYILIKTKDRLELIDLNTNEQIKHQFMQIVVKQDWCGHGLENSQKTKKARETHRELTGEMVVIRKIQEIAGNILIVDSIGGIYLFREGELLDRAGLGMSGCDCAGISVNGKWLGVGSRQDRNIVLWQLHPE